MNKPQRAPLEVDRTTSTATPQYDKAGIIGGTSLLENYVLAMVIRIILLMISRSLIVAITFCLAAAVGILVIVVAGSNIGGIWPYLWMIFFWPWAMTGRTEFTEADFSILILGWTVLIAIVSFLMAKLNPRFHIRHRHVLGIIAIPFLIDGIVLPFATKIEDVLFFEIILFVMYIVCCVSLSIMWMLELAANNLVKNPAKNESSPSEPRLS